MNMRNSLPPPPVTDADAAGAEPWGRSTNNLALGIVSVTPRLPAGKDDPSSRADTDVDRRMG